MDYIRKTQELGILPQVVTVSQAWSGWRDEGSIWKIPPPDFETLLRQAKEFIATLPANELGSRMLLLDNWNEWGEGHYIAPYREYGFGYLDAVRKVFSDAPEPHVDLIPEDIGLGPYDTAYRKQTQLAEETRQLLSKKVTKPGAPEDGLIGWWAFDEEQDSPGGARLLGPSPGRPAARRDASQRHRRPRPGLRRRLRGGGEPSPALARQRAEHRVLGEDRAGRTGQQVVREPRLRRRHRDRLSPGRARGKPCFEVPLTEWSHHLQAASRCRPAGGSTWPARSTARRCGSTWTARSAARMDRPGPVKPNEARLCLGSYEPGHRAHFTGLLDEVKLYGRALSPAEVSTHHQALRRSRAAAQATARRAMRLGRLAAGL